MTNMFKLVFQSFTIWFIFGSYVHIQKLVFENSKINLTAIHDPYDFSNLKIFLAEKQFQIITKKIL